MIRGLPGRALQSAALMVPSDRRAEWLEEWLAELAALEHAHAEAVDDRFLPGRAAFVLGAFPHALSVRMEDWRMDSLFQDIKYSLRVLRRAPGFTVAGALTLALGIGANASIFSLVNGLLFRPPAGIQQPERVVQIARSYESDPRWDNFSWPAMQLIKKEAAALSGVAGYMEAPFVVGSGTDVEQLPGLYVTGSYFEVLGVHPLLGRLIQPMDDVTPGSHPVVVLSHSLWSRRFGKDEKVVNKPITIGARPYRVVGVAPPGFSGAETVATPPALWVPTMQRPGFFGELPFDRWGWSWIDLVGRLADGITFETARASMDVVTQRLRQADPVHEEILVLLAQGIGLAPQERDQAGQVSLFLLGIAGAILLLTCSNVANLFLLHASKRGTEVSVRMALGAGRRRLIRQLMTESLLVAVMAALVAVPVVLAAAPFIPMVFPYPLAVALGLDIRVLSFLCAVALAPGLMFGALPARAAANRDLTAALRAGLSTGSRTGTRLRDGLVIVQLALSLGLVTTAALLGQSLANAAAARPGFEPAGLVAGFLDLDITGRYDRRSGLALADRLLAQTATIPGVRAATVANQTPLVGGHSRATVRPVGREDLEYEAEYIIVGPRYFETLGIPIVKGRPLSVSVAEAENTVVVNEALAHLFWPGQDPVGRALATDPPKRVVGVAADVQMRSLRQAGRPAVYHPLGPVYSPRLVLHLRSETTRGPTPTQIRQAVAAVDPALPVAAIVDLHGALTTSMRETRTIGYLVTAFALLALVLAAVGLYGLVSYTAAQRVREIGIRIALGAPPSSLIRLLLARGVTISVLGAGLGLVVSLAMAQVLQGLLFGVGPTDATTLATATALLCLTAAAAAWLPARRATKTNAALTLRE